MTLYRISLRLCSALVTPLKGDTIWGHIVWGIANHEGDDAVKKFLEQEKEQPVLFVSSAFPANKVCIDIPVPKKRDDKRLTLEKYIKIKEEKGVGYKNASEFFNDTAPSNKKKESPLERVTVMHNTLDRFTNSALDGSPYAIEEKWSGKNNEWDLYVLSSLKPERINQLINWAFENGYGADASIGKGRIEVIGDPVPVEPKYKGSQYYMALGPFVEDKNKQLQDLRADIFIRSGKIGGAFAGAMTPYKKQVVLYDEGAVFKSTTEIQYVGILLDNMHNEDDRICQSGFAPVIPVECVIPAEYKEE